jgi:hypothetical protein
LSTAPRNGAHLTNPQSREISTPAPMQARTTQLRPPEPSLHGAPRMKPTHAARRPFSEFTQALGKQVLHLRLYRESNGFLCERELVESDGTGVTQALPFHTAREVEEFLLSDPHYARIKSGAMKLLHSFALEVCHESASSGLQPSNQFS